MGSVVWRFAWAQTKVMAFVHSGAVHSLHNSMWSFWHREKESGKGVLAGLSSALCIGLVVLMAGWGVGRGAEVGEGISELPVNCFSKLCMLLPTLEMQIYPVPTHTPPSPPHHHHHPPQSLCQTWVENEL